MCRRFMAYSAISNPWSFLLIELLHGPSLGLCWPTMVSYGDKVAPSGTKATIQGLIGAIFEGIGKKLNPKILKESGTTKLLCCRGFHGKPVVRLPNG